MWTIRVSSGIEDQLQVGGHLAELVPRQGTKPQLSLHASLKMSITMRDVALHVLHVDMRRGCTSGIACDLVVRLLRARGGTRRPCSARRRSPSAW